MHGVRGVQLAPVGATRARLLQRQSSPRRAACGVAASADWRSTLHALRQRSLDLYSSSWEPSRAQLEVAGAAELPALLETASAICEAEFGDLVRFPVCRLRH